MKSMWALGVVCGLVSTAQAQVEFSEIRLAAGPEFMELTGPPGTSLNGLSYVILGNGIGRGSVKSIVDMSGFQIDASGFFVVAESDFIWGTPDQDLGNGNPLNIEDNLNSTHLVVSGCTATVGQDLDTNDDGVLDGTPWTSVVADLATVRTSSGSGEVYSSNLVGPDGSVAPSHVYRCGGTWYVAPAALNAGLDTPGSDNPCPGSTGFVYCDPAQPNSAGNSVQLVGSASIAAGSGLHLEASGGPSDQFGYVLVGSGYFQGVTTVLGDGRLCIGLSSGSFLGRYNVPGGDFNSLGRFDSAGILQNLVGTSSVGSGFDVPLAVPIPGSPTVQAGSAWQFQLWYRDSGAGTGHSNSSNALTWYFL
ncbi:MAG: hypothetical protein H6830_07215 [Planctomycetes bacterium]|nr:hypothetical protein [Planctomycetota bacterium]MCB9910188.1 hypothetical protein [Planctomycetota bacterium]MCB9911434.1 hypothetical protein [Planctomycetota bacterium]